MATKFLDALDMLIASRFSSKRTATMIDVEHARLLGALEPLRDAAILDVRGFGTEEERWLVVCGDGRVPALLARVVVLQETGDLGAGVLDPALV